MIDTLFENGRVLLDGQLRESLRIAVEAGRVCAILGAADRADAARIVDLEGSILLPGFIDTQVNGGGGRLFNADPSVETIQQIARTHARFGTTTLFPTLISDDLAKVETAIAAVDAAIAMGVPGIAGIHLEGPFLSTDRKGVHDATKFRDLSFEHVDLLTSLQNGRTLITLSPERASPEIIAALVARGVTVSAGHTNATYTEMRSALDAGVRGFTHLFNAMSPLGSREPGVVGAAL